MNTPVHPIYTFTAQGTCTPGTRVELQDLRGAQVTIPVVAVGETGRGRQRAVLPVRNWYRTPETSSEIPEPQPEPLLKFARVGETRAGRPALIQASATPDTSAAIVVIRNGYGHRGSCGIGGDAIGWTCGAQPLRCWAEGEGAPPSACPTCGNDKPYPTDAGGWKCGNTSPPPCPAHGDGTPPEDCPMCGSAPQTRRGPLPCTILVEGRIADGDAGRMSGGAQHVVLLPRDEWLCVWRSGRLYGAPPVHYLKFTGTGVLVVTREERYLYDDAT